MDKLIESLKKPGALPDSDDGIKLVQTHISVVFLTDEFVYKIKKPVDFGFLDFSTLEKRLHYCNKEIELNRRFSRDIYMEVLPVLYDGKDFSVGEGKGEIIDYAVKMKRIPEELIMKSVFEKGNLTEDHLRDIAGTLANFHQTAYRSPEIDRFGEPDVFRVSTDENFMQTEKYIGVTLDRECYNTIKNWTNDFFQSNRDIFYERIRNKNIRDCHGDLHMEHIFLTKPVSMFDCIEFNDRFRYSDTFADIGFLLMDLESRGGSELAETLWSIYSEITMEGGMESLLAFYKVYRAYVRGKVNSFQLDDMNIPQYSKKNATEAARKYFSLALSYIR